MIHRKLTLYADLVKFEHTLFALPFALSALLLGAGHHWPNINTVVWVILAMIGGRTYAMGLNRIIDKHIDGQNPRTAGRALPAGRVGLIEAWVLTLLAICLLFFATAQLPLICLELLPVAIAILTIYSYVKRFSNLAHLVLGLALGSSAIGGWIAVTGALTPAAVSFGCAVLFWVAGFDIIYACQDVTFDRDFGLFSIPASWGIGRGLLLSRICHGLTVMMLCVVGLLLHSLAGPFYWAAIVIVTGMLVYEQSLVSANDLSRVNEAFFNINGAISVSVLALILIDKWFLLR